MQSGCALRAFPWLTREARLACGMVNKTCKSGSNDTIQVTLRCQMRQGKMKRAVRETAPILHGEDRGSLWTRTTKNASGMFPSWFESTRFARPYHEGKSKLKA